MQEKVITRRAFFKNGAKQVLPFLAVSVLLNSCALKKALQITGCNNTCETGCANDCYNTCKTMCGPPNPCTAVCMTSCTVVNSTGKPTF